MCKSGCGFPDIHETKNQVSEVLNVLMNRHYYSFTSKVILQSIASDLRDAGFPVKYDVRKKRFVNN